MSTFWIFRLLVLAGRMLIELIAPDPLEEECEEDESGALDGLLPTALAIFAFVELTDDD